MQLLFPLGQCELQILPAFLQEQDLVLHLPLHEHLINPCPPSLEVFLAASLSDILLIPFHSLKASSSPSSSFVPVLTTEILFILYKVFIMFRPLLFS